MEAFEQQHLFISGEGGYFRYRIPALEVTTKGTILAFCEGRRYDGSDHDEIDLVLRRSFDGGHTFGGVQLLVSQKGWTVGNPAPVVDHETGTIWLLFNKNIQDGTLQMTCAGTAPRTIWVTHSDDDGATWTEPVEITDDVKPPDWTWYAVGPCHGIQTRSGRLVIPCDHFVYENGVRGDPSFSHVLYSDDHGRTWEIGGSADEGTDESVILEAADGSLYFNCRNKGEYQLPDGGHFRRVGWSVDGGETFSPLVHDAALPEPICQASLCRLTDEASDDRNRVVFSNPGTRAGRQAMTIRLSYDECRKWPVSKLLWGGPSAYSDLCVAPDKSICCFYERGHEGAYETITLARFNLEWLTEDVDSVDA